MTPLNKLATTLKQSGLIKFLSHFAEQFSDIMLKDLSMGSIGEDRKVDFLGKTVTNFGSDSFLGLDQDEPPLGHVVDRRDLMIEAFCIATLNRRTFSCTMDRPS